MWSLKLLVIHSFIPDISIAPLQVHYVTTHNTHVLKFPTCDSFWSGGSLTYVDQFCYEDMMLMSVLSPFPMHLSRVLSGTGRSHLWQPEYFSCNRMFPSNFLFGNIWQCCMLVSQIVAYGHVSLESEIYKWYLAGDWIRVLNACLRMGTRAKVPTVWPHWITPLIMHG